MANSFYPHVPKALDANIDFRRKMIYDAAHNRQAAKQLVEACADDILFYINTFCFTEDPRCASSVLPFITYPFQDETILSLTELIERSSESRTDVAIPKSRDMGASWIILAVFEWLWHFRSGRKLLVVSRNENYVDQVGNSKTLFAKLDFLHEHQPKWLLPSIKRTSMHLANLDNASVIDGESTTGDVGRGDRRTAILMDEFAAFGLNDGYAALSSTLSATNCRIFNSTPKGSANAFYKVCHEMASNVIKLHWSKHPKKNRGLYTSKDGKLEFLDDWHGLVKIRQKGDARVREVSYPDGYPFILDGKLRSPWYDNECMSCATTQEVGQELDIDFMGSDCQFFDGVAVEVYKKLFCREPFCRGVLEYSPDNYSPCAFRLDAKGLLSLWDKPSRDGGWPFEERYVIGADISAGTGASNSCAVVYLRRTGEKVAEYCNSKIEPSDFARYCYTLGRWFNNATIVFDRSGPTGETFFKHIRQMDYPGILFVPHKPKSDKLEEQPGVFLNPQMKTVVLEQYRDAISKNTIVNRSERAVVECMSFIRQMNGTVEHSAALNAVDPGGARSAHGDIVVADALANLALCGEGVSSLSAAPDISPNSFAGRMAERERKLSEGRKDKLGAGWK